MTTQQETGIGNGRKRGSGARGWRSYAGTTNWLIVALFSLCAGSTFISYRPYQFNGWDDAEYFGRSIAASRAFWSGDIEGLHAAVVSIRPPAMTLLGLPWGRLESWDSAGKCFITLGALISILAGISFYLLQRIGVKRLLLICASACVGLSLGPLPADLGPFPPDDAHQAACGFMADSLIAWTALAAILLIPYETRRDCLTTRSSILRGALWGTILSLGVMTKLNFLYFVALIIPVLVFVRLRRNGLRSASWSLLTCACCAAPSAFYLFRFGRPAFGNAKASSFGALAEFYRRPLLQFLSDTFRESPGMAFSLLLTAAVIVYLAVRGRLLKSWPDFIALLIMIGFAIIVFAAPNKQIRYAFPAIVALPFLAAILASGEEIPTPRWPATLAAGIVFCGLLVAAFPMRHRPDWHSLDKSNAVLAAADRWNAKRIVLATDSPTLNGYLMLLATLFSSESFSTGTLAYRAVFGKPIESDLRILRGADLVVFQDGSELEPPFSNQRVPEYEQYLQRMGNTSTRIIGDLYGYRVQHPNKVSPRRNSKFLYHP